ncbi:response regulator transcription factor, partial [Duncaniella muris]|uniref:response regulator transcription factor n=1 Tax=Duncaniella muris TaxID=2094150 RepID=UPI00272E8242
YINLSFNHFGDFYRIIVYSPMAFAMKWRNQAVNSLTGEAVELAETTNASILGPRECQVLSLIDQGLKSAEIAARLNISVHTVSRHRQEILAKLQVKNSIEACRLATRMGLI